MFRFLIYIQPTWYYRLVGNTSAHLLLDLDKADMGNLSLIEIDRKYRWKNSQRIDAAYQGLMTGIIPTEANSLEPNRIEEVIDVGDNYRFIRKYFGLYWYMYVFLIRLMSFHNPFIEFYHFIRNSKVKRQLPFQGFGRPLIKYGTWELSNEPFVSIVIPTLNRYAFLKDVLSDLENQDYRNFEVLVCDQSNPFDESFYSGWKLNLQLIRQENQALWLARNSCIRKAKGEFILLFDDDSRVQKDWIRQHLICLERFNACISAGVTDTIIGHGLSFKETYYHLSDVFDTGNAMVKREVFAKVGLFDRQFEKQRQGDGEFGLRALLSGYQLISNPYAKRIHLKGETGGLREMGAWDAFITKGIFEPRPIPSVLYLSRKYFGMYISLLMLIKTIPGSFTSYKNKASRCYKILGFLGFIFTFPIICLQVIRSWRCSSLKLREGAMIDRLI